MAGIIKSGVLFGRRASAQPAEFNFEDLNSRAEEYLSTVRRQAEAIVNEARQRAARLEEEATERARHAAENAAEQRLQEKLDEKLNTLLPAVRSAVQEIAVAKQSWLNQWRTETVRLAIAIAERIIRRELQHQPEITTDLVHEALRLAVGGGQFKLHMHPDDVKAFGDWVEQLASQVAELAPADVVADKEVSRGGCRVVTQFGAIDQTIEAQLARIEEELAGQ